MSFAGVSKADDRINLIAHLRTLADSPAPIPAPKPAAAAPQPAAAAPQPAAGAAPATPDTPKGSPVPVPTTSDTAKTAAPAQVGNKK